MASQKTPEHPLPSDREESSQRDPIEGLVGQILSNLGEFNHRDGLRDTPKRVARVLRELTKGYGQEPEDVLKSALFDVSYDEMVIVKDIEVFSLCEHHLLPFYGRMHIAYIPQAKVIGLSKTARIVDIFARRLQIQERLTQQVAETIQQAIEPAGVGVICEAQHLCMMMRGVEKQHSSTITSAMMGVFRDNPKTREEFLSLVSNHRR
ncbi:MAG: GTP cyclohydrolase I FolE [Bryobacterales bacterium]|nr:GTP cyclohydrolase I FolE [Bryobacterales bacterium]